MAQSIWTWQLYDSDLFAVETPVIHADWCSDYKYVLLDNAHYFRFRLISEH